MSTLLLAAAVQAAEPAPTPLVVVPATTATPLAAAAPTPAAVPVSAAPAAPGAAPGAPASTIAPAVPAATMPAPAPPATFAAPRAVPPAAIPAPSAATAAISSTSGLTQIAMVLVLVVGLIAGAAWLLRRLGLAQGAGSTGMRIVSGINLSNRERILVVEVADQWIVVGVAPGCINTLATMPRQEPASPGAPGTFPMPPGRQFASWLKQTMDKRAAARGDTGA